MAKLQVPRPILWAGLICGTLDLTAACIDVGFNYDRNPVWLLQNVAGALLGPATFQMGLPAAALGLLLHFTVAFAVTTVFYVLSRRFPLLLSWPVPSGLIFGAGVFLVMYRVVIPLTIELRSLYLTQPFSHSWPKLRWSQLVVHFICVGLPIALGVRRWSVPPAPAKPTTL